MSVPLHPATQIARDAGYLIHVFPFSLYSIMARYTHTLGKLTSTNSYSIQVGVKLVNLHRYENIAEDYMLWANPKGQVRLCHAYQSHATQHLYERRYRFRPLQVLILINRLLKAWISRTGSVASPQGCCLESTK